MRREHTWRPATRVAGGHDQRGAAPRCQGPQRSHHMPTAHGNADRAIWPTRTRSQAGTKSPPTGQRTRNGRLAAYVAG
eukprot:11194452-Lingulodinium_polyedra.AAC.1